MKVQFPFIVTGIIMVIVSISLYLLSGIILPKGSCRLEGSDILVCNELTNIYSWAVIILGFLGFMVIIIGDIIMPSFMIRRK